MYEFKNVSKTYISKRGKDCDALKYINLTLPDKGLIFVCGKSGSGKSTFLNLLGGLDKPTSGELCFNANSFSSFKEADYANYRNHVVGFIFQDYNLIENVNVEQNLMIPLNLQNKTDKKTSVAQALEKVGLKGYEKQKINELSGGQKQRVAIARALVKNPEVILADEPTGNLDSTTAYQVFEILKDLSKSCLVVVVTHDTESAKKYGNYIVMLSDGKVVMSSCLKAAEKKQSIPKNSASLPLSVTAAMGAWNLLKKPFRSVSVILMSVLTIFCIVITQFFASYSAITAQGRIIDSKRLQVFFMSQEKREQFGSSYIPLRHKTLRFLKENYPETIYLPSSGVVTGSRDILNFGYDFIGEYFELDNNSIYLLKDNLGRMYEDNHCEIKNENGEFVKLTQSQHPPEKLSGKTIKERNCIYTIAGIIDTKEMLTGNNDLENAFGSNYKADYYLQDYVNRPSNGAQKFSDISLNTLTLQMQGNSSFNFTDFSFLEQRTKSYTGCVVFADGTVKDRSDFTCKDNEIIVSLTTYNKLFQSNLSVFDYVKMEGGDQIGEKPKYTLLKTPEHLNVPVTMKLDEKDFGAVISENFTLVGVAMNFDDGSYDYNHDNIIFSLSDFRRITDKTCIDRLIVNRNTIKNFNKFLKDMDKNEVRLSTPYEKMLEEISKYFAGYKFLMIGLSIVLIFIMIFLTANTISVGIHLRTKELGILKALGAKNKDLFGIYFVESAIISLITFLTSFGLTFVAEGCMNYSTMAAYDKTIKLFFVDIWSILTVFIASFAVIFLATLIPLLKIRKMRPIDAIKVIT